MTFDLSCTVHDVRMHDPLISANGPYTAVQLSQDESYPKLVQAVAALQKHGGSLKLAARALNIPHAKVMRTLIDHNITTDMVMRGDVWIEPLVVCKPVAAG